MIFNYGLTEMMNMLKDGRRIALSYIVVKMQVQNIFSCVKLQEWQTSCLGTSSQIFLHILSTICLDLR